MVQLHSWRSLQMQTDVIFTFTAQKSVWCLVFQENVWGFLGPGLLAPGWRANLKNMAVGVLVSLFECFQSLSSHNKEVFIILTIIKTLSLVFFCVSSSNYDSINSSDGLNERNSSDCDTWCECLLATVSVQLLDGSLSSLAVTEYYFNPGKQKQGQTSYFPVSVGQC